MSRRSVLRAVVAAYYYVALCFFAAHYHAGVSVAFVRGLGWPGYVVTR